MSRGGDDLLGLAQKLSTLRGERYARAAIVKAEWRKDSCEAASEPLQILKDRHGLVIAEARDGTDTLVTTLLLHGSIRDPFFGSPLAEQSQAGKGTPPDLWHVFSKEEITAFVTAAGDSNELHRGEHPVVPGLLILKQLLAEESFRNCTRLRLKFHRAAFAEEPLRLAQSGDSLRLLSVERLLCEGIVTRKSK